MLTAASVALYIYSSASPLHCSFSLVLQVGFFPCDCVELINDKIPSSVENSVPKPGTSRFVAVLLPDDLFKMLPGTISDADRLNFTVMCVSS